MGENRDARPGIRALTAHDRSPKGPSGIRGPFVISIVGRSASGKSQLARRTAAMPGKDVACRIPTDYFFIPRRAGQSLPDFLRQPLRYDWTLLARHLAEPYGTVRSTPDADFAVFDRLADHGGRLFTIRPVMLVDAMAAFPGADLLVRLDVPDAIRRGRLRERDIGWGSAVSANWEHLEVTWRRAWEEMRSSEIVLDGALAIVDNARTLAEEIHHRLAGQRGTGRSSGWGRGSTGCGSDRLG